MAQQKKKEDREKEKTWSCSVTEKCNKGKVTVSKRLILGELFCLSNVW